MKRFEYSDTNEFDYCEKTRTITGRMTNRRREILTRYVECFNESNKYPYGESPNGYAYTCGHEHDCCGCLISRKMRVNINTRGTYSVATLVVSESYNY